MPRKIVPGEEWADQLRMDAWGSRESFTGKELRQAAQGTPETGARTPPRERPQLPRPRPKTMDNVPMASLKLPYGGKFKA